MRKMFTSYGTISAPPYYRSYGQTGTEPEKKKFNWSDVGVGLGAFGITGAAGLAAGAAISGKFTAGDAAASLVPAGGAGLIAFFLRRACPVCEEPSLAWHEQEHERMTRLPDQEILQGYGAVRAGEYDYADETGWVRTAKEVLDELGYHQQINDSTDAAFHAGVADFQRAAGLTPTGWIDVETAGAMSAAASDLLGEDVAISTVTPDGVGVETHNVAEKKTNWALWIAGIGGAGVAATAITVGVLEHKKKRSK